MRDLSTAAVAEKSQNSRKSDLLAFKEILNTLTAGCIKGQS